MNTLLWILQIVTALLYAASGVMKVFMLDKVSRDVPSFAALPRNVWTMLGVVELICVVGLIAPGALHWQPSLTIAAAVVLAAETIIFVGVHVKYRETTPIIFSSLLGIVLAFVAYGRAVLAPLV